MPLSAGTMLLNVGKQHLQVGELASSNSSVDTCSVDAQFIIDNLWFIHLPVLSWCTGECNVYSCKCTRAVYGCNTELMCPFIANLSIGLILLQVFSRLISVLGASPRG